MLARPTQPSAPPRPRSPQLAEGRRAPGLSLLLGMAASVALTLPMAVSAAPAPGALPLSCPSLDVVLDGFGAMGSSTAGGDARFQAAGGTFGTLFESMAFAPGAGFLEGGSLALPQSASGARRDGAAVSASYIAGPWRFDLRTELADCGPERAVMEQEWTITNVGGSPRVLAFTLYVDGDLMARGSQDDDLGARVSEELIVFDEGSDRDRPAAFIGLSSVAEDAVRIHREVGEFSEQRRRIARGAFVTDRLMRADGSRADLDGDGVSDAGFDVSLAIAHDFGVLGDGESRRVVARIRWGVGSVREVLAPAPAVDAGPDRIVECEGHGGSLVRLDASASPGADQIRSWRWIVDGRMAAASAAAEVLLLPGVHAVTLEGTDERRRVATDGAVVEVVDSIAPHVTVGETITLWPPDHRLVAISLPVVADDACSPIVSVLPIAVSIDERSSGPGRSAAHGPSDVHVGLDGTLFLRAERDGRGDGRVYRVLVEARDASGNLALAEVRVEVPHDARHAAVDSGVVDDIEL